MCNRHRTRQSTSLALWCRRYEATSGTARDHGEKNLTAFKWRPSPRPCRLRRGCTAAPKDVRLRHSRGSAEEERRETKGADGQIAHKLPCSAGEFCRGDQKHRGQRLRTVNALDPLGEAVRTRYDEDSSAGSSACRVAQNETRQVSTTSGAPDCVTPRSVNSPAPFVSRRAGAAPAWCYPP